MEKEIAKYNYCFVCGAENPIGLKLRFFTDGEITRTTYRPAPEHEGYKGIAHGGIIATILDEVMIKAVISLDISCVTAQMEIRYKIPVPIETEIQFEAVITKQKKRIVKTRGWAKDTSGTLYAEATGTYVVVSGDMQAKLKKSLEI